METDSINTADLARRWNLTTITLSRWRVHGKGPTFLKLGRRVVYRLEDIEEFEKKRLKASTSTPTDH